MIVYSARILGIGLVSRAQPPIGCFEPTSLALRAWPKYCDQNGHVNNAHYLTFMDYGRTAWLVRSGFMRYLFGGGHTALVVGLGMTYRRELPIFKPFDLETRVAGYEGRWMYFAQDFHRGGEHAARGIVRVGFKHDGKLIEIAEMLGQPSPPLPDDIVAWRDGADAGVRAMRKG